MITSKECGGVGPSGPDRRIDPLDGGDAVKWHAPLLAPQLIEVATQASSWSQVLQGVLDRVGRWLGATQCEAWCGCCTPGSLHRIEGEAGCRESEDGEPPTEQIALGGAEEAFVAAAGVRLVARIGTAPRSRLLGSGHDRLQGGAAIVTIFSEGRLLGCLVWFLPTAMAFPRHAGAILGDLPAWLAAVWGLVRAQRDAEGDHADIEADRRVAAGVRALVHDLDNALMPLRCRIEILEQRLAGEQDLEQVRAIGAALGHLGRLGGVLRDRIASGGAHGASSDSICLHRWWRRHESLLQALLPEGSTLQAILPESLQRVRISEVDLGQILTNLVTNAAKAMAESPAVVLSAVPLPGGDRVRVSIADNGCGMSPQTQAATGIARSTVPARGSGNGLAIVRSLLDACGGSLEIESTPGRGTRVHLLLPAEPSADSQERPRVVISVRDRALRLVVQELLRGRGAVLCEADPSRAEIGDSSAACWVTDPSSAAMPDDRLEAAIARFLAKDPQRRVLLIGDGVESVDPRVHVVEPRGNLAALQAATDAMLSALAASGADGQPVGQGPQFERRTATSCPSITVSPERSNIARSLPQLASINARSAPPTIPSPSKSPMHTGL